jgi:hypothetical protein
MALLLAGCASPQSGVIPVVDSGTQHHENPGAAGMSSSASAGAIAATPSAQDSGVVVMVPDAAGSAPLQSLPAPMEEVSTLAPLNNEPLHVSSYQPVNPVTAPAAPSGVPAGGSLSSDEQLDGPVLALLTTAQQQQSSGDLNGAASSLERAQRIAPREPQVLYHLAEVRLAQGDAAQAEQLARRGLTYAGGRAALQSGFWDLIAQARERQGDAQGAAQARERAKVAL